MESVKKSNLYIQTQLRNKVEKMNRSEIWALERKLRVMKKESDHFNAMVIRKKRDVVLKLKEIQKCSGHSIMGLPLTAQDKHIKDSPLFNTGIILSEKQFQSWRIKDRLIEKQYKIKELQRLQEIERERSLIQLLKDLKIITNKVEVYTEQIEEEEEEEKVQENEKQVKRFPLIFRKIVNKEASRLEIQRPVTVDCASIRRHYIDTTTKVSTPINFRRKISDDLFLVESYPASKPQILTYGRSKSASIVKPTNLTKDTIPSSNRVVHKSPLKIANPENPTVNIKPKPVVKKPIIKQVEIKAVPDEIQSNYVPSGFAQMPKWKRQLIMEAPVGLNDSISPSKVHVIMSQAQKRRDLEILMSQNVADIQLLAKEKAEKQRQKIENMHATLREMDQLEEHEEIGD